MCSVFIKRRPWIDHEAMTPRQKQQRGRWLLAALQNRLQAPKGRPMVGVAGIRPRVDRRRVQKNQRSNAADSASSCLSETGADRSMYGGRSSQ